MTVLQRKASMQQIGLPIMYYISTHFLTSQPTLIKLDNENIGGHLTPLQPHGTEANSSLILFEPQKSGAMFPHDFGLVPLNSLPILKTP